jgi:tetratricopeptide (TPR) repeat protein
MRLRALILFVFVIGIILAAPPAAAQHSGHGEVNFPTSCTAPAQEHFDMGLGLLHHMMYDQAIDYFEHAADADPECAMAHWGIAMTQLRPLWYPPTEQHFARGQAAIGQAARLGAPTERERRHIDALQTYFTTAERDGHQAGVHAWDRALASLHRDFPRDVDAGAFWALVHTAAAPRDDATFGHHERAGMVLEELMVMAPQHPGLFHYVIHAYDNPRLAERGIELANQYDQLAPEVPHALHMPSHIFVRVGMWPEVIEWNRRSADAALAQPVGEYTSLHHAHALDYMIYGYLQQGQDEKAREVLDELLAVKQYQPDLAAAYGIAAAQARFPIERRDWAAAADLPVRAHQAFPWDDFPAFEAITYWARGMGSARIGDHDGARDAIQTLNELHRQTMDAGADYWALHVNVQRKTVEAWLAYEQGDHDRALRLMREAADLEDSVDKHPVTPSAVLPARELYGDMLSLAGRYDDAITAYRQAMEISPNRFNSFFGIAHAAERSGQDDLAREYYTQLLELTEDADTQRDRVARASDFLADG